MAWPHLCSDGWMNTNAFLKSYYISKKGDQLHFNSLGILWVWQWGVHIPFVYKQHQMLRRKLVCTISTSSISFIFAANTYPCYSSWPFYSRHVIYTAYLSVGHISDARDFTEFYMSVKAHNLNSTWALDKLVALQCSSAHSGICYNSYFHIIISD